MRIFRPGLPARLLYPEAVFRIKAPGRHLCITFDDGPHPDSTPKLLKILEEKAARAIFFCNGANAEKYPELIQKIQASGHTLGNHGYEHVNGFRISAGSCLNNAVKANKLTSSRLFRPPYGHMTFNQYRLLKEKYQIMMWDLMPYDFDQSFGPERTLNILKEKSRPGSVIVLHDSPQSCAVEIIGKFIDYGREEGFDFGIEQFYHY